MDMLSLIIYKTKSLLNGDGWGVGVNRQRESYHVSRCPPILVLLRHVCDITVFITKPSMGHESLVSTAPSTAFTPPGVYCAVLTLNLLPLGKWLPPRHKWSHKAPPADSRVLPLSLPYSQLPLGLTRHRIPTARFCFALISTRLCLWS